MKPLRIALIAVVLLLSGCGGGGGGGSQDAAAVTVEGYLESIAAQDSERAQELACDEMRAFVLDDVSEYADAMAQVDNVACEVIEQGEGTARVVCGGTSTVIGDPEVLSIPVIDRVYVVEQRGGEWLICDLAARE